MLTLRDALCPRPPATGREPVERPILFNEAMVLALLSGRKKVTRRLVRDQVFRSERLGDHWNCYDRNNTSLVCPMGRAGDRLWVREKWAAADGRAKPAYRYFATERSNRTAISWRPSLHMPRVASRVDLLVTDVRIERLHEITEADARAEGFDGSCFSALIWFRELWDGLFQNEGSRWVDNPWVWVIAFEAQASTGSTPA